VTLDNTSDSTPTDAGTNPEPTAAEQAPVKAPRRRATRKTAAPSVVVAKAAESEAPAAPAEGSVDDAVVDAPVRAARKAPAKRTRATKKAAAPVVPEIIGEKIADEIAEDEDRLAEQVAEPAPEPVPEPAVSWDEAPAEAERPAAAGPGAATVMLFQAADTTTRPRRRRAQSPAGPPRAAEQKPVEQSNPFEQAPARSGWGDGTPGNVEAAAAGTDTNTATDADTQTDEAPAPKRTSRRRGSSRATAAVEELLASSGSRDAAVPREGAQDETAEDQTGDEQGDEDDETADGGPRRRRRRGGRGRRGRSGTDGPEAERTDGPADDSEAAPVQDEEPAGEDEAEDEDRASDGSGSSRRRRRRRSGRGAEGGSDNEPAAQTSTRTRGTRQAAQTSAPAADEVTALRGSTRLEAKRQRRRDGRDAGRRRTIVTESEFLARRESVDRTMVVRELDGATQIAVLEDGVLVEHYVSRQAQASMAGNVYLGRVQNVLPSMEAAFVDVGKGRNAVLYAGEVNWDAAGLEGQPRRIEQALKSGDSVLVQVTKDPIGQKGARLTSQVTLAGRYLVYVPGGGMTGISRKLPDNERARLKKLLREIVPDSAGVIVRTAAEGASEEELRGDIARLQEQWTSIEKKAKSASAPALLQGEPDLAIRVVRDIFNGDFGSLVVEGDEAWDTISGYIGALAPDLAEKVTRWDGNGDVFTAHRVDEQLAKGMDRKVWLPSGGSLVIDRTEAMTVVDVNTGKFTGAGGTLEETVTRNNLEAAEEIVRQLRLRDIGGIIVIDFIDMVLESNRDLVLRRLVECLGRDRTKHQVAEVTSLGLVQMTRKRVGQGLVEAFSETCEACNGRGFIVHTEPNEKSGRSAEAQGQGGHGSSNGDGDGESKGSRRGRGGSKDASSSPIAPVSAPTLAPEARAAVKATLATIAAAAAHAHEHPHEHAHAAQAVATEPDVEHVVEQHDGEQIEWLEQLEQAEDHEQVEQLEQLEQVDVEQIERQDQQDQHDEHQHEQHQHEQHDQHDVEHHDAGDQFGAAGPTDLPVLDTEEQLELFPVAPEVFDLGEASPTHNE
jgi:ribonuclease E